MPRSRGRVRVTSSPAMDTVPRSGVSSPARIRSRVDLPPPDGPSNAVSEESGTSIDTSSSAWKPPKRFETPLAVMLMSPPERSCIIRNGGVVQPAVQPREDDENGDRDQRQQQARRIGAGEVEPDESVLHEQRQGLRAAGQVARDDRDGAELTQCA